MNEVSRTSKARVSGERFISAWIDLERLPGGMMTSSSIGDFGPVAAMTNCLITTDETVMQRWVESGKPVLEIQLADSAHEPPAEQSDIDYLAQCLVDQENALSACEKLLKESLAEDGVNADFDSRLERYWQQSKALGDWRSRNLRLSQPPASEPPPEQPVAYMLKRKSDGMDFGLFMPFELEEQDTSKYDFTPLYVRPGSSPPPASELSPAPQWPLDMDRVNEVHEWLVMASSEASPFEGHMLMDAATLIGEFFPRPAPPPGANRSVVLSGYELQAALEFLAPDLQPEQLESEVSIQYGAEGHSGAGYYCCMTEYPEEGSILLGAPPCSTATKESAR